MRNRTIFYAGTIMLALISGCNGPKKAPNFQPPVVPEQQYRTETSRQNNPGSIFAESEADQLFADSRARRVGDIVVVKITESTTGKNKADTTASKGNTNGYGVASYFGETKAPFIPGVSLIPVVGGLANGMTKSVGAATGNNVLSTNSDSDLNTTGETKRENKLTAALAARVVRVMPGGILQIEGAREIRINEETQYMVVTGTIRSRDVAADNSIQSTQIADASIQYYGKGVLADKQKPGWFSRLMDNVWPF